MNRRKVLAGAAALTAATALPSSIGLGEARANQRRGSPTAHFGYLVGLENGWQAAEIDAAPGNCWLDGAAHELQGLYWSEEPRPMEMVMAMGYLGEVESPEKKTTLDLARWASSYLAPEHQWVVALQSLQHPGEGIQNHFAVVSELNAKASLTVLQKPSVLAAFRVMDEGRKLRPYTDCKLMTVGDEPWNRYIGSILERPPSAANEAYSKENLLTKLEKVLCPRITRSIVLASHRKFESVYKPSDVVRDYWAGWKRGTQLMLSKKGA